MKIFPETNHNPEQQSKAHFQGHVVRHYNYLTRTILCAAALIFFLSSLSCTDPVTTRNKHFNKGLAHNESNNINAAIIEFKNAVQIDPMHVESYVQLGKAYLLAGKINAAIETFEKASDINPSIIEDLEVPLARSYMMKGELDKALDRLNAISGGKSQWGRGAGYFRFCILRKERACEG